MKNLEQFQENKVVLAVKGGTDGKTFTSTHKITRNKYSGCEDTVIKDQADVEGKGSVGSAELCIEDCNGVQRFPG